MENLTSLWQSTGIYNFTIGQVFMMLVGFLLLYLAIKKGFEPLLLLPIGFGAILNIEANVASASSAAPLAAVAGSGAAIESHMAGTILKVLVHAGSEVKEGDIVILMEAMKMETEIRSKFAGVVSAIHTKEGAAVTGGSVLVSL